MSFITAKANDEREKRTVKFLNGANEP